MRITRPFVVAVGLVALLACAVGGPRPAPPREHVIECVFQAPEHTVESCLHGLGPSLLGLPDSKLFFEKDSVLRIHTPPGFEFEPHHAHLFHRVDVHLVEQVLGPADAKTGILTINLADYAKPEKLIVTSADHRATPTPAAKPEAAALGAAILPPYALSFDLVSKAGGAATLLSLQPFKYELESPLGTLQLLVTPANRGDMLLSLVDLDQKLSRTFKEAYFHYRPADAALAPRLTVEVETAAGRTWQRTGAWPVPPGALAAIKGAEGPDAFTFALRTFRKDLIPFGPPAELMLAYPKDAPQVTANLTARISGMRKNGSCRLVIAHAVPDDRAARSYSFKTQTVGLTHDAPEQSFGVDLSHVDASRFPVTAAVTHRLVTAWTTKSGLYAPEPPIATYRVAALEPDGPAAPAHIIAASSAAYYDLVNFSGMSGLPGLRLMRQLGATGGTSPNTTPTDAGSDGSGWTDPGWSGGGTGWAWTPTGGGPGAGGSSASSSSGSGSNLNWAPEMIPPPPNPPAPPEIDVRLKCGCKYAVECKCPPHMWNMIDVMNRIMASKYVVDSAGRKYEVADYAWFGSHGASVPCHERKQDRIGPRLFLDGLEFDPSDVWRLR